MNGKSPDQMNPDEFEEYLGLQNNGGLASDEFYYGTQPNPRGMENELV